MEQDELERAIGQAGALSYGLRCIASVQQPGLAESLRILAGMADDVGGVLCAVADTAPGDTARLAGLLEIGPGPGDTLH